MKCNNCGNEILENSAFCTFCGSPLTSVEATDTPVSAVKEKILNIFKDKLFLALCILVSISTVFSIANRRQKTLPPGKAYLYAYFSAFMAR